MVFFLFFVVNTHLRGLHWPLLVQGSFEPTVPAAAFVGEAVTLELPVAEVAGVAVGVAVDAAVGAAVDAAVGAAVGALVEDAVAGVAAVGLAVGAAVVGTAGQPGVLGVIRHADLLGQVTVIATSLAIAFMPLDPYLNTSTIPTVSGQ